MSASVSSLADRNNNNNDRSSVASGNSTRAITGPAVAAMATILPSPGQSTAQKAKHWIGILAWIASFIMFIVTTSITTSYLGSNDDWSTLQPQISKVLGFGITGTVLFIIAAMLYFISNPKFLFHFIIITAGLALGLAYMAVSLSVISKA
jgi:hypothetical protein